jgi:ADP-ribose pyrophosphatase
VSDIQPEQTLTSETVFAGQLIGVRKDTVRLHNGETKTREIVVHADVVAILAILADGRIVFVRQYRKAVDRILLEIPAGGVDPGETSEEAVRREMVEETGYRVGKATRITSFYTSPGFTTENMHLFTARDLEPGKATEDNDQIEVEELSLIDAMERWRTGDIADAKTILALLWYERSLFQ